MVLLRFHPMAIVGLDEEPALKAVLPGYYTEKPILDVSQAWTAIIMGYRLHAWPHAPDLASSLVVTLPADGDWIVPNFESPACAFAGASYHCARACPQPPPLTHLCPLTRLSDTDAP